MFTVFAQHGDIRTRLDAAALDYQARLLARRWSRTMTFDVIVMENGQEAPRCIYRQGLELHCACPGTGAAPPMDDPGLPAQPA